METVRFLRDVEDEKKYAQGLELAYVDVRDALTDLWNRMSRESDTLALLDCENPYRDRLKELRHIIWTAGLVIQDCADRRARLADVARGLSNVVFDEETPES